MLPEDISSEEKIAEEPELETQEAADEQTSSEQDKMKDALVGLLSHSGAFFFFVLTKTKALVSNACINKPFWLIAFCNQLFCVCMVRRAIYLVLLAGENRALEGDPTAWTRADDARPAAAV